jgi:hypothetical protein
VTECRTRRDAVRQDFGLLIVGLISVEPGFVTMGPDESSCATGPASAMVGGVGWISIVGGTTMVCCPKSEPPSKDDLIPANRTLVFNYRKRSLKLGHVSTSTRPSATALPGSRVSGAL